LRTATIAVGAIAGPGVLFVLPYILPIKKFSVLAAVLATSQLVGVLGAFGLDIACPRLGISLARSALYSGITISIAALFVCISLSHTLPIQFIIAVVLAWILLLSNIFHSYSLFAGLSKVYGMIGFLKALFFLIVFIVALRCGINPELAWLMAAIAGLLTAFILLKKTWNDNYCDTNMHAGWKNIIEFSLPSALIVATSSLPFVIDRVIAQDVLGTNDFARYTVAVTWAVPILYFGNIAEKTMIATTRQESLGDILKWAVGLLAVCGAYSATIILLALFFIKVPYFQNNYEFFRIWGLLAAWYTLYTVVHNPTFAYIQKQFSTKQLKPLSMTAAVLAAIVLLSAILLINKADKIVTTISRIDLIIFLSVLLALASIWPKIYFVIRNMKK
jgi:hypothetical protein